MKSAFAIITFVDQSGNPIDPGFGGGIGARPGDPGYGHPEGGHPDHDLPWAPGRPSHGLPGSPGHPSTGPIYGGGHPSTGPVRPPHTWPPQAPQFPPDPTDPEWGVDVGGSPSHPIYIPIGPDQGLPGDPAHPSQGLPPVAGGPKPPTNPPPGTVWPPLPPGAKPGKAALLFWLQGVGYRYVVVDLSTGVDNTLPGTPARPGNELPESPSPKR